MNGLFTYFLLAHLKCLIAFLLVILDNAVESVFKFRHLLVYGMVLIHLIYTRNQRAAFVVNRANHQNKTFLLLLVEDQM